MRGETVPFSDQERASRDTLRAEMDGLLEADASAEPMPEEVDRRLAEIDAALAALDDRPARFDPAGVDCAGAVVSIDGAGGLRIQRG